MTRKAIELEFGIMESRLVRVQLSLELGVLGFGFGPHPTSLSSLSYTYSIYRSYVLRIANYSVFFGRNTTENTKITKKSNSPIFLGGTRTRTEERARQEAGAEQDLFFSFFVPPK